MTLIVARVRERFGTGEPRVMLLLSLAAIGAMAVSFLSRSPEQTMGAPRAWRTLTGAT